MEFTSLQLFAHIVHSIICDVSNALILSVVLYHVWLSPDTGHTQPPSQGHQELEYFIYQTFTG